MRALGRIGAHEYRVFLPAIATDVEGLPSEVVHEYRASSTLPGRIAAMAEATLRGGRLARRFAGLDALHFPLTVMLPRVSKPPAAVTVLDVQHELLPEFFSRAELLYRRAVYGWSVRRSRLVLTISRHAADAIVDRLGVPETHVRPIHLGIDHALFRPDESVGREPFLLYPAREWPHKNHARFFAAFAELRRRRPELELVLTSYAGPVPDGVRSLGFVSRNELADLYRRASALVFPSLYEGFGQPPLEAMACGCPVACSNAAALPEVVGDAARLFEPGSVDDIVAAVEEALAAPEEWRERGLRRAARFTWEETARRHDEAYSELVA